MTPVFEIVSGPPSRDRLPYDWGDGWYRKSVTQAELIKRTAMHGVSIPNDPSPGIDLPFGMVYGLRYEYDSGGRTNIWRLGVSRVGQDGIQSQTPVHF